MPVVSRQSPSSREDPRNRPMQASTGAGPSSPPSLSISSTLSGITGKPIKRNPPSRERVSEAIAMVRARQAAAMVSSSQRTSPQQDLPPTENGASQHLKTLLRSSLEISKGVASGRSLIPERNDFLGATGRTSPARTPFTPKGQAPISQLSVNGEQGPKSPVRTVTSPTTQQDSLSPREGFFFNSEFETRASETPINRQTLTVPTFASKLDDGNVDQENDPCEGKPVSPRGFIGRGDVSRGRSRREATVLAAELRGTLRSSPHDGPASIPRNSTPRSPAQDAMISRRTFQTNSVDSSDDGSVDPDTLADVSRFIDALHKQKVNTKESMDDLSDVASSVPTSNHFDPSVLKGLGDFIDTLQQHKTNDTQVEDIRATLSGFSDASTGVTVDPETLEGIGMFIDSLVNLSKKAPEIVVYPDELPKDSSDSSDDDDDSVPSETRAGIGAFIDSLQKKNQTPTAASQANEELSKGIMYVSSSDDSIFGSDDNPGTSPDNEPERDAYFSSVDKYPSYDVYASASDHDDNNGETSAVVDEEDDEKRTLTTHVATFDTVLESSKNVARGIHVCNSDEVSEDPFSDGYDENDKLIAHLLSVEEPIQSRLNSSSALHVRTNSDDSKHFDAEKDELIADEPIQSPWNASSEIRVTTNDGESGVFGDDEGDELIAQPVSVDEPIQNVCNNASESYTANDNDELGDVDDDKVNLISHLLSVDEPIQSHWNAVSIHDSTNSEGCKDVGDDEIDQVTARLLSVDDERIQSHWNTLSENCVSNVDEISGDVEDDKDKIKVTAHLTSDESIQTFWDDSLERRISNNDEVLGEIGGGDDKDNVTAHCMPVDKPIQIPSSASGDTHFSSNGEVHGEVGVDDEKVNTAHLLSGVEPIPSVSCESLVSNYDEVVREVDGDDEQDKLTGHLLSVDEQSPWHKGEPHAANHDELSGNISSNDEKMKQTPHLMLVEMPNQSPWLVSGDTHDLNSADMVRKYLGDDGKDNIASHGVFVDKPIQRSARASCDTTYYQESEDGGDDDDVEKVKLSTHISSIDKSTQPLRQTSCDVSRFDECDNGADDNESIKLTARSETVDIQSTGYSSFETMASFNNEEFEDAGEELIATIQNDEEVQFITKSVDESLSSGRNDSRDIRISTNLEEKGFAGDDEEDNKLSLHPSIGNHVAINDQYGDAGDDYEKDTVAARNIFIADKRTMQPSCDMLPVPSFDCESGDVSDVETDKLFAHITSDNEIDTIGYASCDIQTSIIERESANGDDDTKGKLSARIVSETSVHASYDSDASSIIDEDDSNNTVNDPMDAVVYTTIEIGGSSDTANSHPTMASLPPSDISQQQSRICIADLNANSDDSLNMIASEDSTVMSDPNASTPSECIQSEPRSNSVRNTSGILTYDSKSTDIESLSSPNSTSSEARKAGETVPTVSRDGGDHSVGITDTDKTLAAAYFDDSSRLSDLKISTCSGDTNNDLCLVNERSTDFDSSTKANSGMLVDENYLCTDPSFDGSTTEKSITNEGSASTAVDPRSSDDDVVITDSEDSPVAATSDNTSFGFYDSQAFTRAVSSKPADGISLNSSSNAEFEQMSTPNSSSMLVGENHLYSGQAETLTNPTAPTVSHVYNEKCDKVAVVFTDSYYSLPASSSDDSICSTEASKYPTGLEVKTDSSAHGNEPDSKENDWEASLYTGPPLQASISERPFKDEATALTVEPVHAECFRHGGSINTASDDSLLVAFSEDSNGGYDPKAFSVSAESESGRPVDDGFGLNGSKSADFEPLSTPNPSMLVGENFLYIGPSLQTSTTERSFLTDATALTVTHVGSEKGSDVPVVNIAPDDSIVVASSEDSTETSAAEFESESESGYLKTSESTSFNGTSEERSAVSAESYDVGLIDSNSSEFDQLSHSNPSMMNDDNVVSAAPSLYASTSESSYFNDRYNIASFNRDASGSLMAASSDDSAGIHSLKNPTCAAGVETEPNCKSTKPADDDISPRNIDVDVRPTPIPAQPAGEEFLHEAPADHQTSTTEKSIVNEGTFQIGGHGLPFQIAAADIFDSDSNEDDSMKLAQVSVPTIEESDDHDKHDDWKVSTLDVAKSESDASRMPVEVDSVRGDVTEFTGTRATNDWNEVDMIRSIESCNNSLRGKLSLLDEDKSDVSIHQVRSEVSRAPVLRLLNNLSIRTLEDEPDVQVDDIQDDIQEESELLDIFLKGSDIESDGQESLTHHEPSGDEDQMEAFLAKLLTFPESGTTDQLDKLTFYVTEASALSKCGTNQQQSDLVRNARSDGIPIEVINEIANEFFPSYNDDNLSAAQNAKFSKHSMESQLATREGETSAYEGASKIEVEKVNQLLKIAAAFFAGKKTSSLDDAEMRRAATQLGVSADVLEELLGPGRVGRSSSHGSEGSSRISAEISLKHTREKLDDIEDVDDREAISAYFSRMTALKDGGLISDASLEAINSFLKAATDEEVVKEDADTGYTNRRQAHALSNAAEEQWWEETSEESIHQVVEKATRAVNVMTIHDEVDEPQPETLRAENSSKDWDHSTKTAGSDVTHSSNPKSEASVAKLEKSKSQGSPKRKSYRVEKESSEKINSETQIMARKPMTPKTILRDFERMFHEREKWMIRKTLAHWRNPWEKRWVGPDETSRKTRKGPTHVDCPRSIGGVAAAAALARWMPGRECRRLLPVQQQWKLAYKVRTKCHPGYHNVDVYSLYEASAPIRETHSLDVVPWEHREVKQRFLHEQSILFSRNWFGDLTRTRGNDKYREPVCRPKSMEMPMENRPDQDWSKEWYTTWQSRKERPRRHFDDEMSRSSYSGSFTERDSCTERDDYTASVYTERESVFDRYDDSRYGDDDEGSWEEAPECGTIQNVRQKIGERASRVHPDFTSSLRRSRWRRKYFPRGTFPY